EALLLPLQQDATRFNFCRPTQTCAARKLRRNGPPWHSGRLASPVVRTRELPCLPRPYLAGKTAGPCYKRYCRAEMPRRSACLMVDCFAGLIIGTRLCLLSLDVLSQCGECQMAQPA